jgi:ribonuclease D
MPNPQVVNSAETLAPWLQRWASAPWLAVDTEFVRVDTYYPKLCLIQIGDGENNVCIDTVALTDLSALFELLARKEILNIFHSGSQDLEIFVQITGACPTPFFDTQTAATLLGLGDQIGYAPLVEKMLGITLDKSLTRTDWSRRPLTSAELDYAALDVKHLATIYGMLKEQLVACGRLGWLEEECVRAANADSYRIRPEDAWRKLKGMVRLPIAAQVIAATLCEWRESTAQQRDRPRKWIIEDDAIYRMAERVPKDHAQLEALNVLPPKTLARHGDALLGVIRDALTRPARAYATDETAAPEIKARIKQLQERIRAAAETAKLPASFIAPRADIEAIALQGAAAKVPLLEGWRKEVVGAQLLVSL